MLSGYEVSPFREVEDALPGVGHLPSWDDQFQSFCPSGGGVSPFGEVGTPVRRAARWGRLWGCASQSDAKKRVAGLGHLPSMGLTICYYFLPFRHSVSPSGEVGTPMRRAARRGRLWGYAPFAAPLASPPEAPPKKVFRFLGTARARGSSCGSFLPSLRSVR